jgi:hypothetical protein
MAATPTQPETVVTCESQPPVPRTRARLQAYFLRHFAMSGSVGDAAARIGIAPRTVQRWRRASPAFASRYDEVLANRLEILEDLAVRRASSTDRRAVFHRGRQVATVERHNDVMLMRVLARFDKARLREQGYRSFSQMVERKVAERVRLLQSEYAHLRERLEHDFDSRVQKEVKKQMSRLSRSTRHAGDAVTAR